MIDGFKIPPQERLNYAQEYEAVQTNDVPEKPLFHLAPRTGWMNDPNGFSYFGGAYHMFYQYYPYATNWGPMHWGHAVSRDLVQWEYFPVAIAPDMPYDCMGCFSGSAVENDGKHVLMYTGVLEIAPGDPPIWGQEQCIAIGDGKTYSKYENNPVIPANILPEGSDRLQFRDPKIYRRGDVWRAVVGNQTTDKIGQAMLFESKDLINWEFRAILHRGKKINAYMYECPDLFTLVGKDILMVSPQCTEAVGELRKGNNSAFIIGNIENNKLVNENVQLIDCGPDFYAPQSTQTPDNRRVICGWLKSWDNDMTPKESTWSGFLTIPRELSIKNGRIYQNPVRELENYRTNSSEHSLNLTVQPLNILHGRCFDTEVEIHSFDAESIEISVASDETHETKIILHSGGGLTIDRTKSGMADDKFPVWSCDFGKWQTGSRLRIIMDRYSIELFKDNGEYAASAVVFTPLYADRIAFLASGSAQVDVQFHELSVEH